VKFVSAREIQWWCMLADPFCFV